MMIGIIGLPRSGKSTYLAKISKKYNKKGEKVFSNFYIKGCYKFDFNDLGKKDFHDCVILIDEISLFADCRNFKEFGKDLVYFFTNYGHYNVKIYWCSQSLSADKKIRDLTDELYRIKPLFWHFSYIRRIVKDIDNETLTDIYKPSGFPKLCFRKMYYKYFDSFCRKTLPPVQLEPWYIDPSNDDTSAPSSPSSFISAPQAARGRALTRTLLPSSETLSRRGEGTAPPVNKTSLN